MSDSGYDVERETDTDRTEWNRLVERSSQGTPFHRFECLELLAERSDIDLLPLACYNGQEPVGVFPVFERSYSFVSTVFSPPPGLKVPYLGPILLDHDHLSKRNLERRQWRLVSSCLEAIESESSPQYLHFRSTYDFRDPRPFDWEGFDVLTGFTYVVDLTPGREQIFDRFSSDARSNVRECEDAGCTIELAGKDSVERIVDQVRSRYADQGESYPLDSSFVEALYERTPSGVVRPYVCTLDGEFVGGNVVLASENTWFPWVGAATPESDLGINDALHWRAMQESIDRGARSYDLVGADTDRLSAYKSKFGPALEPVYTVRRSTRYMRAVEQVYRALG